MTTWARDEKSITVSESDPKFFLVRPSNGSHEPRAAAA